MTNDNRTESSRIAAMSWGELERSLAVSATRGPGAETAEDEALRRYFGPEELEELRRIAAQSASLRSRAAPLGNVVFLPGIMGSNLATTDAVDAMAAPANRANMGGSQTSRHHRP